MAYENIAQIVVMYNFIRVKTKLEKSQNEYGKKNCVAVNRLY